MARRDQREAERRKSGIARQPLNLDQMSGNNTRPHPCPIAILADEILVKILDSATTWPVRDALADPFGISSEAPVVKRTRRAIPRVSRKWNSLATQFMYQDLRFGYAPISPSNSYGDDFTQQKELWMLSRKLRQSNTTIRRLVSSHTRVLAFKPILQSFSPEVDFSDGELCHVLSHTSNLECFSGYAHLSVPLIQMLATTAARTLTHLDITFHHSLVWPKQASYINSLVNLSWLRVTDLEAAHSTDGVVADAQSLATLSLPNLTFFEAFSGKDNHTQSLPIAWHLITHAYFPQLRCLRLHKSTAGPDHGRSQVRPHGYTLTHLYLEMPHEFLLKDLESLCPRLIDVAFKVTRNRLRSPPESNDISLRHATLQHLSLSASSLLHKIIDNLRSEALPRLRSVNLLDLDWSQMNQLIKSNDDRQCALQWALDLVPKNIHLLDKDGRSFGGLPYTRQLKRSP